MEELCKSPAAHSILKFYFVLILLFVPSLSIKKTADTSANTTPVCRQSVRTDPLIIPLLVRVEDELFGLMRSGGKVGGHVHYSANPPISVKHQGPKQQT